MKKLIVATLMAVAVTGAYGQGTFNFSNFSGPVDAPVRDHNGAIVGTSAMMAGVAWAQGTVSDPAQLSLIPSATTAFLGQGFPGYFFGPNVSPGAAVNGTITLQVLYWNSSLPGGSSFATAKATQGGEWANSALFQVSLGASPLSLPADMVGLTPVTMTLNAVPEPSTLAFLGLGTGALLIFRRRK